VNPDIRTEPRHRALVITTAGVIGTLLLAAAVLVFVRLGFWQLSRLEERRALNAAVAARLDAPPVQDVALLQDTAGLFYRAVEVAGRWDIDRSIVLPGRSHRGVPGVYLLTPLLLDGRADAVLVNRGWVPAPDAATIDVADFAVAGNLVVRGLVLPFPSAAESLAQRAQPHASTAEFRRVWFSVDADRLREQYPYVLLPATVQQLPEPGAAMARGAARYPTRLEPPPLDEGPHLGYALQWFSFALIGIIGWVALVMRSSRPPRVVPPPLVAACMLLACAAPADAQLRPLEPAEWRVFDEGVWLVGSLGAGVLWEHHATLAGSRGRLLEAGNYAATIRSGRIALSFGGTAIWRMSGEVALTEPFGAAAPVSGSPRQDAGRALASTLVRLSPATWPTDIMLRFGATIPTTSDESGLERDRTDFFALVGARHRTGRLTLVTEHGVGINGTVHASYPQSDVWAYVFGASWQEGPVLTSLEVIGHQDGHGRRVRGNEDQREVRIGFDVGERRWLRIRYVHGLGDFASHRGVRAAGGFTLGRAR
jgi:surfeit locus 1 family protein